LRVALFEVISTKAKIQVSSPSSYTGDRSRIIGTFKMIHTRKATIKDLPAINELTFEMHDDLGALVGLKFNKQDLADEMYERGEDLKNVYVAENNTRVVGYMAFSKEIRENEFFGRYYHLYHIVVKKEFRRKGAAFKLFSILLRKAEQENVNIVTETLCSNKGAKEFFSRMRFKPMETVLILDRLKKLKL
jgi:ribosomal protein S18 acetylase RimI-like enzyme